MDKQSRMDSLMESVVNIVIGLVISTIANWLLLGVYLGYPMHLGTNILISVVFTVISLVRSYTLRRIFNGRSVWAAIKEKFNGNPDLAQGQVDAAARVGVSGVPLVRRAADRPPVERKRHYYFHGVVDPAAEGARQL